MEPRITTPPINGQKTLLCRIIRTLCMYGTVCRDFNIILYVLLTILHISNMNKEQEESLRMESPCHSFAVSSDNLLSGKNNQD